MTDPDLPRYRLAPGPAPATADDLRAAQERERLLRTELTRVREAAVAWRNGLGALLVALVGFGLIKGRSDIGQLAPAWARWVGLLLLFAILAGATGALLLIRAAHGRPAVTAIRQLPSSRAADHIEALASAVALRWGIIATLGCALLLVSAVAATWYGPERDKLAVRVTTPAGVTCGSVVRLDHGTLVLKTDAGEVTTDLNIASTITAVAKCP
ncbi:hypothetical protein [Amycolatopsis sp. RTGN1]|uniref:hypothetical protein n=1 Tax=Amycolatopsis ponsaeliensis TaxID=2992142 RepID=UPI002549E28A|nr:hypothetical protein [Amycolatopsis sp. RTGN1]